MRWHRRGSGNAGALGHNKVLRMKAKRNRYDLSLWDVRKLSLYGSARESVQAATLTGSNLYWVKSTGSNLTGSNQRVQPSRFDPTGKTRGCFMRMAWITLHQPRRNKT